MNTQLKAQRSDIKCLQSQLDKVLTLLQFGTMPTPSAINATTVDMCLNYTQKQILQATTMLSFLNLMMEQRLAATLATDINKKMTMLSTSAKVATAELARKTQMHPVTQVMTAMTASTQPLLVAMLNMAGAF